MAKPVHPPTFDEHEIVARGLGKWSDPDMPKSGWTSVYVFDLGKGSYRVCEMCETIHIRFVHVMQHKVGLRLESGCICAGHMAGDIAAARKRDDDIQRAAGRVARRAKALAKAKETLAGLHASGDVPLPIVQDKLLALERLRKVAARRSEGAEADAKAYDTYYAASQPHRQFLQDVDHALAAARKALNEALAKQRQRDLQQDLAHPNWWRTPKGSRFTTIHGDKAQVFAKGDRFSAMYELAGQAPVWARLRYDTVFDAQERVLAVLERKLRKAKRLPPGET